MFPDSIYEERVVALETRDLVIAYTDGVVEAANQGGEEWGAQGLLKAAIDGAHRFQNASDLDNLIFHFMDDFSRGRQTDDATLAVLQVI